MSTEQISQRNISPILQLKNQHQQRVWQLQEENSKYLFKIDKLKECIDARDELIQQKDSEISLLNKKFDYSKKKLSISANLKVLDDRFGETFSQFNKNHKEATDLMFNLDSYQNQLKNERTLFNSRLKMKEAEILNLRNQIKVQGFEKKEATELKIKAGEQEERISQLEKMLEDSVNKSEQILDEMKSLREQELTKDASILKLKEEVQEQRTKVASLQKDIKAEKKKLSAIEKELKSTKKQVGSSDSEHEKVKEALEKQIQELEEKLASVPSPNAQPQSDDDKETQYFSLLMGDGFIKVKSKQREFKTKYMPEDADCYVKHIGMPYFSALTQIKSLEKQIKAGSRNPSVKETKEVNQNLNYSDVIASESLIMNENPLPMISEEQRRLNMSSDAYLTGTTLRSKLNICDVCVQKLRDNEKAVKCSECNRTYHAECVRNFEKGSGEYLCDECEKDIEIIKGSPIKEATKGRKGKSKGNKKK